MLSIDTSAARAAVQRQQTRQAAETLQAEGDDVPVQQAALRKTALHQAFELNDDLSGLLSSLRRSRAREPDGGDVREQAWLDHVLEPKGPEKASALRLQLQQQASHGIAALRTLVMQLFPDASDAVAVLKALMSEAELSEIRETLAELHDELIGQPDADGRGVRAGLNIALKARLHAPPLQATAVQLRHTYREFLAGGEPLDAYEQWIEVYGFERRTQVVAFIEQALAADMYALDPSCTRIEFGMLLQRVRQLTTLRSADTLLISHCWHPALMSRIGVDQPMLLGALLRMIRHGGGLAELIAGMFGGMRFALDMREKRLFAHGIRRFLKALPHGLWQDAGLQLQVEDEVDAVLDRILAHERGQATGERWVAV